MERTLVGEKKHQKLVVIVTSTSGSHLLMLMSINKFIYCWAENSSNILGFFFNPCSSLVLCFAFKWISKKRIIMDFSLTGYVKLWDMWIFLQWLAASLVSCDSIVFSLFSIGKIVCPVVCLCVCVCCILERGRFRRYGTSSLTIKSSLLFLSIVVRHLGSWYEIGGYINMVNS